MYREWSADFEQIQKLIKDADSVIREFGPERSLTLTRTIVQSIKCDCSCAPSNTDPVTGSESVSNTDLFNPPASLSVTKDIREALIQVGRRLSANMFGPPIHLETNGEVQWALHAITYGLTLPFEHWDVIKHSLHIYCFWLRSLAPCRSGSVSLSSACPQVFRREPHRHFTSILFALTYAFLPRSPDPLSDRIKWLISSIGQTVCKRSSIDEAVESTSDVQNVSDRPTLQTQLSRQLELTRMVTHCIESLLSQSNEWAPAVWDSVLQFCLVICHYVLAFPLPIPGQRILPSTGIPNVNAGGSTGVVTGAALATAVGTAGPMGSSSVAVTITAGGGNTAGATVSDSGYSGEEVNKTVADLAENIAESVFGLLMNTWLKACTYCFPRPQMWVALKECVKVWRHQTAVLSIWSSCVIALTSQLLLSLHKTVSNKSTDLNSSILGKISPTVLPPEMSLSAVKEAWFRFLHIMGNPVDLCDPHVLATPVLEECRKTTATQRVGRASVYLPYIYHQMIRAVANVVDGFLGIQPSLTIGVHAALGVPLELYGLTSVSSPVGGQKLSVVESDGLESKKFSLTGNAAPQIQRSSLPYEKSSSRKLRLGGMVTSASHLASAGAGMRHSTFGTSALQMDAALTPLGTTPPTLSSLASSLNQSAIGLSPLSSTHLVTTKPGISGALVQVPSGQSQTPGARPSVVASGSTPLTFGSIISPQLVLLNTMANHWLGPETGQTVCVLCPEANSLLHLFGAWLFEASIVGAEKDLNISVITTRCDQFSSGLSFQVGRAEALSTLCRIVIYARRHNLAREYLIRFYLCLYYGLETETGRNLFTLSAILFSAIDLLRVDLPGINILLPRLFAACKYVFHDENVTRPDYLTMTMLRRAAIHQFMSMVCIPVQFKSVTVRCLVPISTTTKDPLTMNDLKMKLACFLCDTLTQERDATNLKMLLGTSLALLEDMAVDEAMTGVMKSQKYSGEMKKRLDQTRTNSPIPDTAWGFFNALVPCLCGLLDREPVVQFVLEILGGVSAVRISPPDPIMYRDTVHQICDFIAKQLKRDSKDHKRQLHSIIVAAYSCLSQWLVEHSHLIITDRQCLEVVLATIEFGICGAKSKPTRHEIAEAQRNPNDSVSLNPPKPRALKSLNPSSKRVRDAAEACLAVLVSLAGQFPGASGPETTCSRLIEDHLLQLISPDGAILSTDLWQKLRGQFRYFWSEPGVIVGILETSQCRDVLLSHGFMSATHPHDLPQTLLVVRGPFGRHIWAVQMRLLPKAGSDSEQMTDLITTNGPPRPKPWGCFLERLIRTVNRNETIQPLNFPPSVNEIPLLDADHTIGTLEQIGGAPGTKSREDINTLKSLIAAQSARMKEIGTRSLKTRLATPCPDPSAEATPPTVRTSFQAARLLLTHLGYLTVNSFSMLGPDATNMRLTQSGSIASTNGTGSVTDMRPSGQSNSASDNPAQTGSPPTAITTTATTAASNPTMSTGSGAPGTGVSILTTDPLLQPGPLFYAIDSTHPEFVQQLESLDRLPTRTADTLLVFYVARGQTKTEEILGNMRSWSQLPTEFHAFLRCLGSYVDVSTHPGWTGRPETSYRPSLAPIAPRSTSTQQSVNPIPDAAPDGTRQILYAADSITELACLCPTDLSLVTGADDERSCASSTGLSKSVPPRVSGPISGRHGSVVGTSSGEPGADPTGGRVAVVWLQHWQDGPLNSGPDCPGSSVQNLTSQTFGCPVTIYISQLSSKLYRVGVIRAPGRVFDAGPLISGMVLSKRCLSSFVRQTVCNIARCRRLASDQFQPPHVRRQYRVFELGQTCRLRVDSLVTNNQKARVATHAIVKPETLLGLFTAAV